MQTWQFSEVEFESDMIYKILLISGNTTLKKQIIHPLFFNNPNSTKIQNFGCNILRKEIINWPKQRFRIMLWDINLEHLYDYMRPTHYKGTKAVIFLFDFSNCTSWQVVPEYYQQIIKYSGKIPFLLIGIRNRSNNSDSKNIDIIECVDWAEHHGGIFMETSANEQFKVDTGILSLLVQLQKHRDAIFSEY